MVVIRLNRVGTKKKAKYRVTVADSRRAVRGQFIEVIGHFNPTPRGQEKALVMDIEKAKDWISKGAQPTDTVRSLIRKAEAGKI